MVTLLSKIFIKQKDENERRGAFGILCSVVGICLNIFLFAIKFVAGYISGSVAITADAFNNLSDAGSSFVALLGFAFAGREPDAEHPFGHGRYEYIAGFVVSIAILLMGFELLRSSLIKIIHPEPTDGSIFSIIILIISIIVKIYMYAYNTVIGKKISSSAMQAVAKDSLSDVAATSIVLLAVIVQKSTGLKLDGYSGVFVAFFIIYAGYEAARDTIDPLLGLPPDKEFVKQVEEIVLSHEMISGIHDLVVHDYGPDRRIITLHAEVPGDKNIIEVHELIDQVERELKEKLNCQSLIHMDPVMIIDAEILRVRKSVIDEITGKIDKRITIHDFRIAKHDGKTMVLFDAAVPYDIKMKDRELEKMISQMVLDINIVEEEYGVNVDIDRFEG